MSKLKQLNVDHADSGAELCQWECRIHGTLPVSRFSKEDLSRKRHRCKRCLADKMAVYRTRLPLRHMWNCFLHRAREQFDADAVHGLRWIEHGQPLISELFRGVPYDARSWRCYKLVCLPGHELQLQHVRLVRKRNRANRPPYDSAKPDVRTDTGGGALIPALLDC